MKHANRAVLARWIATGLLACSLSACGSNLPWVQLNGHRYRVEIADDDAERARGLMYRNEMAVDHGMLFLFEHETPQSFWMMNTHIPLDILYFDAEWRLVSVSRNTPPCSSGISCPSYPSKGRAKYVLELNAGQAKAVGLKKGDRLTLGPGIPPD
ncbi:MAG: DUF192 domain-containing protein [Xanthomonadales bacterium]|nr:DUF192 domain-containing protein [Xanthomonadales bacterium]